VPRYVIRQREMREQLETKIHPLNEQARRDTFSLGDAAGLGLVGLHYTVVKPGDASTELHTHVFCDEFIFVLSGTGQLELDGERVELAAGDFVGLPARGPSHRLVNSGSVDLVYLVGGNRPAFDICDYPQKNRRLYYYADGDRRVRDFVDRDDVDSR
jgi:uncharacterized cupin superfamily protein